MKKIHMLITLALAFIIVGCSSAIQTNEEETSQEVVVDSIQVEENLGTESQAEKVVEEPTLDNQETAVQETESQEVLFSNSYREFNQDEYEIALDSDYYVVLDFYSDWCPSCNKEDVILQENFNSLENIIVFRVNHGDGATSVEEEEIADIFEISKRDSGIVLKDGVEVLRYNGHKNKDEYMELFNSLI